MKFDAEFLKKQVFWVLLIVVLPLVAIALIVLWASVGGIIAQEESKMSKELKDLQALKDIKTQGDVAAAKKRADVFRDEETKVWKKAYEAQKAVATWPEEFES